MKSWKVLPQKISELSISAQEKEEAWEQFIHTGKEQHIEHYNNFTLSFFLCAEKMGTSRIMWDNDKSINNSM